MILVVEAGDPAEEFQNVRFVVDRGMAVRPARPAAGSGQQPIDRYLEPACIEDRPLDVEGPVSVLVRGIGLVGHAQAFSRLDGAFEVHLAGLAKPVRNAVGHGMHSAEKKYAAGIDRKYAKRIISGHDAR